LICLVMVLLYRISLGGMGLVVGIFVLLMCYAIGLICNRLVLSRRHGMGWKILILAGLCLYAVHLLGMFLLQGNLTQFALSTSWLPLILLLPSSTLLVGLFLDHEIRHLDFQLNLNQSLDNFETLFYRSPLAMYEKDMSEVYACLQEYQVSRLDELPPEKLQEALQKVKIIRANDQLRSLFGFDPDFRIDSSFLSLILPEESYGDFIRGTQDLFDKLQFSVEGRLKHQTRGRPLFVSARGVVLPGHEKDFSKVLVTMMDITTRRDLENQHRQRAQNYQQLFQDSPVGLVYLNAHQFREVLKQQASQEQKLEAWKGLTLLDANLAAYKICNCKTPYQMERKLRDHFQDLSTLFTRVIEAEEDFYQEQKILVLNSGSTEEQHVIVRLSVAKGKENNWDLVLVSMLDISAETQAQLRLMDLRKQERHLFENSPTGLVLCDGSNIEKQVSRLMSLSSDLRAEIDNNPDLLLKTVEGIEVLDINQTALRIFEAGSLGSLSEFLRGQFNPWGMNLLKELLVNAQKGNQSFEWETQALTSKGNLRHLLLRITLLPGFEESWKRVYLSITDVTEREKLVQDQKKQESRLLHLQKMESLGQLAGGIAHDFNNVIGAIMGYGSMGVMLAESDKQIHDTFQSILEASSKASELANRLLVLTKEQEMRLQTVELHSLLQETLNMAGAGYPGVELIAGFHPDPIPVKVDQGQIQQVFLNLFINSIDALKGDGQLAVLTDLVEESVQITVTDNGCGMEPQVISRIFDPYFTTKSKDKGSGLGLYSAYQILLMHHGEVHVESEPGKGTSFIITLPVSKEEIQASEDVEEPLDLFKGKNLHVFLIDDQEQVLNLTGQMLESLGFELTTALSAKNLPNLDRIPDIVILDWAMPGISGPRALQAIIEKYPDTKVLLSSGHILPSHPELNDLEFAGFLRKPYTVRELLLSIGEILEN